MRTKIFADGASFDDMKSFSPLIVRGFTTNPTLMRKAGVTDYREYAKNVLIMADTRPVSFEVVADDFKEMERQALEIAGWGENIYVKIPIMNTKWDSSASLIRSLSKRGVKVNVTAVMTLDQVTDIIRNLNCTSIISIFAGRIADTGIDPVPIVGAAAKLVTAFPHIEILWASSRQVYNVIEADQTGCHIITLTPDLIRRMHLIGKSLNSYSHETVSMFYNDAQASGITL